MGNSLSDQLLKLGLVDEKTVKKAKHTKRQSNKKLGRQGVESKKSERQVRATDARERQRTADRQRDEKRARAQQTKESQNQVKQLIESGRITGRTSGRRRFYVVMPDGRIPYLELSDQVMVDIERGRTALAFDSQNEVVLITSETASRVDNVDASRILVWNQPR